MAANGFTEEEIAKDYNVLKATTELEKLEALTQPVKVISEDQRLQNIAKDHKAGNCVDFEDIFEAYKKGYISESDAMNSDF